MLQIHNIKDLSHPALRPYLEIRKDENQHGRGVFVAEGEKITRRLLESPLEVASLLLPDNMLDILGPLAEQRAEEIHVFVAPKKHLELMTGTSSFQGVTSVGRIPSKKTEAETIESVPPHRLFLAVDEIIGTENMGIIARNAAAFRADALVVGETCCSPWLRKAVRASLGAVFQIETLESDNLPKTLEQLRKCGMKIVATHGQASEKILSQTVLTGDVCLVMAADGQEPRDEVLAMCDKDIIFPTANGVDSLPVGISSAVLLYEAVRQRTNEISPLDVFDDAPLNSMNRKSKIKEASYANR